VKRLSKDQISILHEHDISARRPLEGFEVVSLFGLKSTTCDNDETAYWSEISRRIFPEELRWSDSAGSYVRRPEMAEEVSLLAQKHPWMTREPWNADLLLCWHEFDWQVKKSVSDYSRTAPRHRETDEARGYEPE